MRLTRSFYVALATGDVAALDAQLHPSFVGHTTEGLPLQLGGTYCGRQEMIEGFWWRIGRNFVARAEPDRFHELTDGGLLVLGRYCGTGRHGGATLDAAFAHILHFDDGRIISLLQYTDSQRWADALVGAPAQPPPLTVDWDISGSVATIRLARPDAHNAINVEVVNDLYEAVLRVGDEDGVRAVLLSGEGAWLSSGGDLAMLSELEAGQLSSRLRRMIDIYHLTLDRISRFDVPVVCAVHGAAAGGGLGLVHVADIVIAAEDSKFALGYAALGLVADGGNTWYLPRTLGMRRAQELFFMNRVLDGAEALQHGLVTEVVADEEVDDRALAVAQLLASGPTAAFGRIKQLLRQSQGSDISDQLAAETAHISAAGGTADAHEGIDAFVHKRPPTFRGC